MATNMMLKEKISEAIRTLPQTTPEFAVILGTGLGALVKEIKVERSVPYEKIPHFSKPTVLTHEGHLIFGALEGRRIVAMEGRFHYYEGFTPEQITFPVRVMRALGAKVLIVSNACGGLNPQYAKGDLMLIEDHINLMGINPLVGPNDESLGPRFPDMSAPYDREFLSLAERLALESRVRTRRGVYVALTGPNLETRAEYRFLRTIGADVVGMSTVPEVIAAVHGGFRVLGISIITDMCLPDALHPVSVKEIIAVAGEAEPRMTKLIRAFVAAATL